MYSRLAFVALLSLLVTGCDEMFESARYHEEFHQTIKADPKVQIYLETMNGSVEIRGGEQGSIEMTGVKSASSEAGLKALKIDVAAQPDSVRIRAIPPSDHRGNYAAQFVLRVPRSAVLNLVQTSNAQITVEDVDGASRLRTSNARVTASRLKSGVEVRTSNGSVDLNSIDGNVIVQTSNASIRADEIHGALDATTSNSSLRVNLDRPEPQRPIRLATSNGSVELSLGAFNENDIRVNSSNGGITVRLPRSISGQLKARTSNGSIDSDFDVMVRAGELRKSWLEGSIGSGRTMIDLSTSNAGIKVLQR